MKRTYLNREMTRAFGMDHPIGDPFGGPAYGKKDDPVSVIMGAISIMGGLTSTGWVAGLLIAGGVMQVVGGLTGNTTLTKLGGLVSLGGGVLGMASSAFQLGDTVGTFGGASSAGDAAFGQTMGDAAIPEHLAVPEGTDILGRSPADANAAWRYGEGSGLTTAPDIGGGSPSSGSTALGGSGVNTSKGLMSVVDEGKNLLESGFKGIGEWYGKQPEMVKYGIMQAGSGMLNNLASAPSEENEQAMLAKLDAETEATKARTDLTLVEKQRLEQQIAQQKQQILNRQYVMPAGVMPTVNTATAPIVNRTSTPTFG